LLILLSHSAVAMMSSFVGMIYYGSNLQNRRYYQGPDMFGFGPNFVSPQYLAQQIIKFWRQGDNKIIMTGYSRGAAMVIAAAAILDQNPDAQDVTIEAMYLFDAVAKSPNGYLFFGADCIPTNVRYCYHAIRWRTRARTLQSFNHPFVPDLQAARAEVLSRGHIHESFPDGETFVTVEQEKRGSQEVHDWMWHFLPKHRVL
jgi:hypothetical protein